MNILQKLAFSPLLVQLVITRRCNLSCGYCNEYDKTSPPVPTEMLKKYIDRLGELGTLLLTFFGGEPLLHPDLIDIIAYAKTKAPKIGIITNGFLLNKKNILQYNEAGLDGMQISIDGVRPNDVTVKVLDNLRGKLELLAEYAKFKIVVNTVVGAVDPEESLEVIQFAKKLGFYSTVGVIHDDKGQIKLSTAQRKVYDKLIKMRKRQFWEWENHEKKLIDQGVAPFKCRSGSRYLYVDEFGNVLWCSQKRDAFKKPLLEYTIDDLKKQFYTPKPCNVRCTLSCARNCSMLDKWRRQ